MVEISTLGSTLAKMGIHLSEKEMIEALKHATIDGELQRQEIGWPLKGGRKPIAFQTPESGRKQTLVLLFWTAV